MPIMTASPSLKPPVKTVEPVIQDPRYQSIVVDNFKQPVDSLLTYIDGSNWVVIYFSQVLNNNSDLSVQQMDRSAVYQQYKKIENLEVKVTSSLSQSQDTSTKSMTVTGSALTYPHLIPNEGDMFVADIGNGKQGVFTITHTEKKSYLEQACFQIDYQLIDDLTEQRLNDLETKTVQTFKFVRDFLIFGQNPQIIESDFQYLQYFNNEYKNLLGLYYRDFFSNTMKTFCVPGQKKIIYDHFLVSSFLKIVDVNEHPLVKETKILNVMQDYGFNCDTVWDCVVSLNYSMLSTVNQKIKIIDSSYFNSNPLLAGIFFSRYDEVVYPQEERTDVDSIYFEHDYSYVSTTKLEDGGRRFKDFTRLIRNTTTLDLSYNPPSDLTLPDIDKITNSNYYIFSPGFYGVQNHYPTSNLEVLLLKVLKQELFDKSILKRIVENAKRWDNLERFYFIPFLLLLMKITMRSN